jgi:hypothetical protein
MTYSFLRSSSKVLLESKKQKRALSKEEKEQVPGMWLKTSICSSRALKMYF